MKKFIACLCAIVILASVQPCMAKTDYYEYGALSNSATMEGSTATYIVVHNNGGFTVGKTTEESHTGKYSYFIDTKTPTKDDKYFTAQFYHDLSEKTQNCNLFFEGYIKAENASLINYVSLWYYTNTELSKIVKPSIEETPDENGWYRFYYMVTPDDLKDCTRYTLNVVYNYSENDGISKIYFDDLSARIVPTSVRAENISCKEKVLPLRKARLWGYDAVDKADVIKLTDLAEYSIISGNAYIDENKNLVYTGASDGIVRVEADFYGKTDLFDVEFDLAVNVSEVTKTDKGYSVTVENNSNSVVSGTLFVTVYDGNRLALVNCSNVNVAPNTIQTAECSVPEIPYYVKNPTVKAFYVN